jgi:hypothetical protein
MNYMPAITLPEKEVFSRIYLIRNHKVMLGMDLALLYDVHVKALNQALKRNIARFPQDFMFQLTKKEWDVLRSQFVTLETGRGMYPKYLPYAFTEQGVSMLSSVLNSPRAIAVNIEIMRLFVKMRQMAFEYGDLLKRIEKLEERQMSSDLDIANIFKLIKELLEPAAKNRVPVGFKMSKS